ncbi:MAG: AraC family transcriptional regulator [Blautia sp.]|nr:AraC family transcriptional regulator [Blautia sp.]MDY4516975.1 helix-turn-helix domain-containing protein [Lachnospiraceae bacterium]
MPYISTNLRDDIKIEKIVSIHYFEYMNNFIFEGEAHNFWEFCCVDKGDVEVSADGVPHLLHKGEIIFHKPNEFHTLKANGKTAPNLVVMSFHCSSSCMDFFRDRVLTITDEERSLLAQIITEARECFASPLDDPYLLKLERKDPSPFASEQLIRIYLEQFLLQMCRRCQKNEFVLPPVKSIKKSNDLQIYDRVRLYLEAHLYEHISIESICRENLIGRSQLQKIFRERTNSGVINYFSKMKIDAAKQMIRESNLNFSQIAEKLGYTSVHYFSRQFKKVTGMSPSEYASSIKALSERKSRE